MNPDLLYALIPLAPFLLGGLAIWTRHQRRMAERHGSVDAEKAQQYAAANAKLEARVRVLEQIVTDAGAQTASQIEALRERPLIDNGEAGR
jgi:hypothetical protein